MPFLLPSSCCACRTCSPNHAAEAPLPDHSDKVFTSADDPIHVPLAAKEAGSTTVKAKAPADEDKAGPGLTAARREDGSLAANAPAPAASPTLVLEEKKVDSLPGGRKIGRVESGKNGKSSRSVTELDHSDLKLSRGLSVQLGLSTAGAEDDKSHGQALPPTPGGDRRGSLVLAVNRGVQVEAVYEFCTVRTKIQVREMGKDVIHRRIKEEDDDEEMASMASLRSNDSTSSDGSQDSVKSAGSGSGRKRRSGKTPDVDVDSAATGSRGVAPLHDAAPKRRSSGPRYTRTNTLQNAEALSRWGLIVGSLLHSRALDFGNAAQRAIVRRQRPSKVDMDGQRGKVFNHVREAARVVTKQARKIARRICREPDMLDSEWEPGGLLVELFGPNYVDNISIMATAARKILAVQPSLAQAKAPCRIFGDLHGHFRDLLLLFVSYGGPDEHNAPMFVFNGDFVDRGDHQIEVIGLLLALKVLLPERIWLVRGNHEDRAMNRKYGFAEECRNRLGPEVGTNLFDLIHKVFDHLPIACLIDYRVLVVHGGIGDGAWKVDDIRSLRRPLLDDQLYDRDNYWIYNILWSDPIEDDDKERAEVFGVHKSPRGGLSTQFGWNVTKTFCARNGLGLVVRSHQSKHDSLGFDVMHEELLMRVFSARDYEGHGNDAAVLFIQPQDPEDPQSTLLIRPQVLAALGKSG
mmetsp:Transcript_54574/g.130195  ORF Transcript_54574/g.130195 Transcript_54574/m.130195 type:complete len:690 (-) Transcript_54574:166-2235(-)